MNLGIEGKIAMVSAASKGIGLAVAKALADEGCLLSICSRDEANLTAAAEQIAGNVQTYIVDVSNPEDLEWWVQQTVTDVGPPSILITNTGGPPAGSLSEVTDEQWQAGFDGTLMNIIRLTRLVAPLMAESSFGRLVHVTSLVAKEPSPFLPISSTLRSGISALTKLQAVEFGKFGITANAVLPGHTLTDRQTHLAEIRASKEGISIEEALSQSASLSPLNRLGTPEEIAAVVVFLCSVQASYLTGEAILVDGAATKVIG